jgi:hypothetical protein
MSKEYKETQTVACHACYSENMINLHNYTKNDLFGIPNVQCTVCGASRYVSAGTIALHKVENTLCTL